MGFSGDVTMSRFGFHFLFDWQKGSDILNLTKLLYDLGPLAPDFADPIAGSTQTVGQRRLAGFGGDAELRRERKLLQAQGGHAEL
jgi:hypothetical protein